MKKLPDLRFSTGIFLAGCSETDLRSSGTCLDLELCSALRLAAKRGSEASLYFGLGHKNVFFPKLHVQFESNLV